MSFVDGWAPLVFLTRRHEAHEWGSCRAGRLTDRVRRGAQRRGFWDGDFNHGKHGKVGGVQKICDHTRNLWIDSLQRLTAVSERHALICEKLRSSADKIFATLPPPPIFSLPPLSLTDYEV